MTGNRRLSRFIAVSVGLALLLTACSHHKSTSKAKRESRGGGSTPSRSQTPSPGLTPPPVPSRGAYLGAWINPGGQYQANVSGPAAELNRLDAVQAQVGKMAILHAYTAWSAPVPVDALNRIAANGSVPLLDWGCGSSDTINQGGEDEHIRSYAETLKSFGKPVFLRYAWEINLRSPHHRQCLGQGGPSGFIESWRHIVNLFREAGASNVAFVWSPGVQRHNWKDFYPGADFVDWIGVDGYLRSASAANAADGFKEVFGTFYQEFSSEGRPIMIAETGAAPEAQGAYLSSLATVLPNEFPLVKAVVYFDAPGPRGDWSLTPQGLSALANLSRNPYFAFHS